jgi:hypothetical protein
MAEANLGDQALKARTSVGRGTGATQIIVDDRDICPGPPNRQA